MKTNKKIILGKFEILLAIILSSVIWYGIKYFYPNINLYSLRLYSVIAFVAIVPPIWLILTICFQSKEDNEDTDDTDE